MKKQSKLPLRRICVLIGAGLLVAAVAAMLLWQWQIHRAEQKAAAYVQTIRSLIPQPQSAAPEPRQNNAMPQLSVDGTDFLGILEMPKFGSALPVCAQWGDTHQYPCRLSGSIYDATMQIGATAQKGQYDFYREISVGDGVFFTDMEGNRFAYQVTDIRYEKHADQAALQQKEGALTLFIQNIYSFEYVLIFCNTP